MLYAIAFLIGVAIAGGFVLFVINRAFREAIGRGLGW